MTHRGPAAGRERLPDRSAPSVLHKTRPTAGRTRAISAICALLVPALAAASIQFDEVAQATGLGYSGESYGASFTDMNADGWPDLFVSHHRNPPSIYLNDGEGGFVDQAGLVTLWQQNPSVDQHGGAFGDVDNDGDADLMIGTGRNNNNQFLRNENGILFDRTTQYNVAYPSWAGRMAVWFDQNNDGLLDFIMGQYNGTSAVLRQSGGVFIDVTAGSGSSCLLMPYGQLLDLNNDGRMDLLCAKDGSFPSKAYDVSKWPFQDITARIPAVGTVLDTELADFDGNGKQDVFYLRGTVRSSAVVQAGPRSLEAALVSGTKSIRFSSPGTLTVTIDWQLVQDGTNLNHIKIGSGGRAPTGIPFQLSSSDPSVHGIAPHQALDAPAVYIGYDPVSGLWTITQIAGGEFSDLYVLVSSTANVSTISSTGFWASEQPMAPVLHLNNGAGFTNGTAAAGLSTPVSCASAAAGDFDNDTDVDLYLACRTGTENLPNRLLENVGNGVFQLVPGAGGAAGLTGAAIASGVGTADSVVAGDYDVDGFLDLFVTNGLNMRPIGVGGPQLLFRNRGGANTWVQLDLAGVTSNRDGVGARVFASSGGVTQLREQNGRYHRWSQHDRRLHFGLGQATTVDLRIEWPSGQVDLHDDVAVNKVYRAVENGGLNVVPVGQPPAPTLSIADSSVSESAGTAVVQVSLQPAATEPVTVDYIARDGGAVAGQDFESVAGTLLFDVGDTIRNVSLVLLNDQAIEGNENLEIELGNATNATLGRSIGQVTILDDEASICGAPAYNPSSDRAMLLWKDCATGAWTTRFTAAGGFILYTGSIEASAAPTSVVPFSVESNDVLDWTSDPLEIAFEMRLSPPNQDGFSFNAPAGTSYCVRLDGAGGGNGTVLVGPQRVAVSSPFNPDTLGPCAAPQPTLQVGNASAAEDAGTVSLAVTLAPAGAVPVSVDYATADGTAVAGADYAGSSGTLVFQPGEVSKTIPIALLDDALGESNESFQLLLSNAINAILGNPSASATIVDDDQLTCGAPSYNPASDRALLIWRDCGSGAWVVRTTAAGGYARYSGSLLSSAAFTGVSPYSYESGDVLTSSPPTRIDFVMAMSPPNEDGFSFQVLATAAVCVNVSQPAAPTVLVGPQRTPVTVPFNLHTLGPC